MASGGATAAPSSRAASHGTPIAAAMGVPWEAALLLGAAVAPPDATAVAALGRLLPARTFMKLKAESLTNDGTALVLYAIALSLALGGQITPWSVTLTVLVSYVGGAAAGIVVAAAAYLLLRRLSGTLAINLTLPLVLVVGDEPTSGPRPWDVDQIALASATGALTATTALGRGLFADPARDLGVTGGFGADGAMAAIARADVAVVFGASLNQFTMRFGELFFKPAGAGVATILSFLTEEFIHHNLVLRQGPVAAVAAFSYRVRTPEDLDRAVAFYTELGCRVERRAEGFTKGIGESVRVEDPLGFPYEFFYEVEHVERLAWRYDLYTPGALVRLDHFNQVTPDVPRAVAFMQDLGFRVTEDIQDDEGTVYAAWMRRKPTVHDTAMTGGDGPRMH
ncbi:hypothetical protein CJ026_026565, partial [Ralstonia pickettii]